MVEHTLKEAHTSAPVERTQTRIEHIPAHFDQDNVCNQCQAVVAVYPKVGLDTVVRYSKM
jgi:hypothetical protein